MQGGRSDSSVLGWWGRFRKEDGSDSSGYESEVEVTERLSLGHKLDEVVHALRTAFAVTISMPVAWISLHSGIPSFRERKFKVVQEGTQTVVNLQKKLRNPVLDVYFQVFSFFAEEEFYLLVLPLLIWNVDRVLGRRLTLIVTVGLMIGNIMKDVFALPRPASPPVWRPSHQEAIDSTNLQDFGFPSTHAMNAVSNSIFTFLYLTTSPEDMDIVGVLASSTNQLMLAFCVYYIFSLSFSRLYLGAHSPTDLRGGFALGFLWTAVFFAASEKIDMWYLTTSNLFFKLLGGCIVALLLNPQPRPPTPTFSQNALICGLVMGTALGCRQYYDVGSFHVDGTVAHVGSSFSFDISPLVSLRDSGMRLTVSHPLLSGIARTILGYLVVLILRVIAKTSVTTLLKACGVTLKPKHAPMATTEEQEGEKENKKTVKRKFRIVRLFTRDIDILGNAVVKVVTYAVLAWAITFFVPILHYVLGLGMYEREILATK